MEVLINLHNQRKYMSYEVSNDAIEVATPFMIVLTDFGIASSDLILGQMTKPEITQRIPSENIGPNFFIERSKCHILRYKALKPFCRDLTVLLKWCLFHEISSRN